MVRKAIRTVAFVLFAVLVAPFAGHAKVIKPPTAPWDRSKTFCASRS